MKLSKNFKDWACSFSGCDGGNLNADTWICGIEWGGGGEEYYKSELPNQINNGVYSPLSKYLWGKSITGRDGNYGRSLAKLYAAILGREVRDYANVIKQFDGSEIFKMNLYPIAFKNTNDQLWKRNNLDKVTGFEEKYLFTLWCFFNRFPAIAKRVSTMSEPPKVIICTGVGYLVDFFACFAGNNGIKEPVQYGEIQAKSHSNQHTKRSYYWAKLNCGTLIVVVPFFSGSSGLNSDYLLQEMGEKIRQLKS